MLIVERQQRVLDVLKIRRTAELDVLAREVGVSSSTIRRDLEAMEQRGVIKRTHGGAIYVGDMNGQGHDGGPVLASPRPTSATLTQRLDEHSEEKRRIGALVAALIQPHMTVLLDGGSTVIYAVQQITARPIQVVTNSLSIANHFNDDEQVEILLLGGSMYPRTGVTVGPITTGSLADLHADVLLFSLAGIFDDAAYNINLRMARVEQLMLRQATASFMLMDSSKFGRRSLVRVCGLDEVDHVVTDAGVDASYRETMGDRLLVAE